MRSLRRRASSATAARISAHCIPVKIPPPESGFTCAAASPTRRTPCPVGLRHRPDRDPRHEVRGGAHETFPETTRPGTREVGRSRPGRSSRRRPPRCRHEPLPTRRGSTTRTDRGRTGGRGRLPLDPGPLGCEETPPRTPGGSRPADAGETHERRRSRRRPLPPRAAPRPRGCSVDPGETGDSSPVLAAHDLVEAGSAPKLRARARRSIREGDVEAAAVDDERAGVRSPGRRPNSGGGRTRWHRARKSARTHANRRGRSTRSETSPAHWTGTPMRACSSATSTSCPRSARRKAAVLPAGPPPTTRTSTCSTTPRADSVYKSGPRP